VRERLTTRYLTAPTSLAAASFDDTLTTLRLPRILLFVSSSPSSASP
jgi:hypothetical protein